MYSFMLTNWTTLRGPSSVSTITTTQSEAQWLDLRGFEDFVAWLEVREVTLPTGATHITLTYQTSPTKDELFFTPCATALNLDTLVSTATYFAITPVVAANASVPLARWLRFQLAATGAPSAAWDATFRIWIAANIGATPQPFRARMPRPPVRQGGKSCSCDANRGGSQPASPIPPRTNGPMAMRPGRPGMNPAMLRAPLPLGMPGGGSPPPR